MLTAYVLKSGMLERHLVDPESLYSRLQGRITPTEEDFESVVR